MMWYWQRLLVLVCLIANLAQAYTADDVFKEFKQAYEKSKNFTAEFEETTIRNSNKGVAKGRISFSKPNLLRQEYVSQENPDNVVQLIVLDGNFSWSYTPFLNQINRMRMGDSRQKELIPGIGISLEGTEKNYNIELVLDEAAHKKGVYQLKLTPKPHLVVKSEGGLVVEEVLEIWIDTKDWLPVKFGYRSETESGDKMSDVVALKNIKRNLKLNPKVFQFEVPKDAEIVDLTEEE